MKMIDKIAKLLFTGVNLGLFLSLSLNYIKGNTFDSHGLLNIVTAAMCLLVLEIILVKTNIISNFYSKLFVEHSKISSKILFYVSSILYFNLMIIAYRHYSFFNLNENTFALINVFLLCISNLSIQQIETQNDKLEAALN